MHEFSIAQALVRVACESAARAGAGHVSRVNCRIGVLRMIEPDLMREAFEAARGGTVCADSELSIESVPLRARCGACGKCFDVCEWEWSCPSCGGAGEPLPGGDELELVSLEVEREAVT